MPNIPSAEKGLNLKINKDDLYCKTVVFIAVFIASANGIEMFGLSGNKLCLIPLEIYLIFHAIATYKGTIIIPRLFYGILSFHLLQIVNSLIGLCNYKYYRHTGYASTMTYNIIQCAFIYIPIILGVISYSNKKKLWEFFLNSLIWTVRIQCIWALVQFLLWYVFSIDFNTLVFGELFNGFFGTEFSTSRWMWANGESNLKITGINHDAAFLSEAMLLGTCFDRKKSFKLLYFLTCVFAMSRVGVIAHIALYGFQLFSILYKKSTFVRVNRKKYILTTIGVIFVICVGINLYQNVGFIRQIIQSLIFKMSTISISNNTYGTSRHVMYPLYCWGCWFFDMDFISKIIGVGSRASGLAFLTSDLYSELFTFDANMLSNSWDTECEISAMLLGNGILGLGLYFSVLITLVKSKVKEFVLLALTFFVYGFMYNMFTATFGQLVLIFILMKINMDNSANTII